MAYAEVTVTGRYTRNKLPSVGKVLFVPTVNTVSDNDGNVVIHGPFEAVLDNTGAFSIALPATDDPNLNPTGFGYRVIVVLKEGVVPEITISLPAALVTLDLTDQYPLPTYDGWTPVAKAGLTVGTVETTKYEIPASATITGDFPNQELNLSIPRGEPGLGNYAIDPLDPTVLIITPGENEHVDPEDSTVLVVTT